MENSNKNKDCCKCSGKEPQIISSGTGKIDGHVCFCKCHSNKNKDCCGKCADWSNDGGRQCLFRNEQVTCPCHIPKSEEKVCRYCGTENIHNRKSCFVCGADVPGWDGSEVKPSNGEEWAEEFDKKMISWKFHHKTTRCFKDEYALNEIKDFIRSTLSHSKTLILEELDEMGYIARGETWSSGYNKALEDIKRLIKEGK